MVVAEKREEKRNLTLELKNDGNAMLWINYLGVDWWGRSNSYRDTGWPIKATDIEETILRHGLDRLASASA